MSNKRKFGDDRDDPDRACEWERSVVVGGRDFQSLVEVEVNTAQFRARILPDTASLLSALDLAKSVGLGGLGLVSYFAEQRHLLLVIKAATDADADRLLALGRVLALLNEGGAITPASYLYLMHRCVSTRETDGLLDPLFQLVTPFERYAECTDFDSLLSISMSRVISSKRTNAGGADSMACKIIRRCTNAELDQQYSNSEHGQINALAHAVICKRPHVLALLIKRLPGIEFDIFHLRTPCKPISLFQPTDDSRESVEIRELIAAGERIMREYHATLKTLVSENITSHLGIPPLAQIVNSYCARPPLRQNLTDSHHPI